MCEFPTQSNEAQRLLALEAYQIMDTLPEQAYDDIARLAAQVCGVERGMVAFVDEDRKWHKARFNVQLVEVPRGFAICSRTIMSDEPLIIPDTLACPEFADIGMVTNPPYVRFYAGVPLIDDDGYVLGTVCAIDSEPRDMDAAQVESLGALARQVMQLLKLRKNIHVLEQREQQLQDYQAQLDEANKELQVLSVTDHLTGLNNRRALQTRLQAEIKRSQSNGSALSLLVIDIDHFKRFNDDFGHCVGDQVLIQVAERLQSLGHSNDFIARYGGEEFVILLPDTALTTAQVRAEQYRAAVAQRNDSQPSVTISIGVAEYDGQSCADSLFKAADRALLSAKSNGRNCVRCQALPGTSIG